VVRVPQHIIQRGNNRQAIFAGDGNMNAYDPFLDAAIHLTHR